MNYSQLAEHLKNNPRRWLVTGAAGFIGSNLSLRLLDLNQSVWAIDNFFNGSRNNISEIDKLHGASGRWSFVEGDINDTKLMTDLTQKVEFILHQAAVGSVPRSLKDPLTSHRANVDGFLSVLNTARLCSVKKMVFASSSSVYGDHPALPKSEPNIGEPLSPYAATKRIGEIYARVFARCYQLPVLGLRYFNVFGPRQNPQGPYAAVIPLWINSLLSGEEVYINGDGTYSRDFCFIENVLQANILAAFSPQQSHGQIYNIAFSARTDLNQLYAYICAAIKDLDPKLQIRDAVYRDVREGDIPHSHADITLAKRDLNYAPVISAADGIKKTVEYYFSKK